MRGQIYFLCTVDLEHDSLWGHYWVVASSREKASRSPRTLLQPTVRVHILLHICVCVWVCSSACLTGQRLGHNLL